MIFITVGAQMPFDRLVRAVDGWAGKRGLTELSAQIGEGGYRPRNARWSELMTPDEFRKSVQSASLVVAHAGMGSILTALQYGRPILVMPRRGDLGETRNDHQLATARRFALQGKVAVALDERELARYLDEYGSLRNAPGISPYASPELLTAVREFITSGGENRS